MKPRIVFVLGTLDLDGATMWQLTLLQHFDHDQYDVHLLLLNHIAENDRVKELMQRREFSITELVIPTQYSWRTFRYLRVRRALKQLQPDLIFNSTLKASALIRIAAHSLGVPSVNIYHHEMPHFRRLVRIQDRLTRRWSTHCVGVSRKVSRSVTGLDSSRLTTIHNALERAPARTEPEELRKRLDLRRDQTTFLNVARLQPFKNQLALVEAFAGHARDYPDDVLLIAGWGPLADQLRGRIQELRAESNIRLLGAVDDVWSLYQLADFFVLPSISEGFGVVLLEAMSCGLPLVVTDVPVFQEIIEDNAVLIPGTDAPAIQETLRQTRTLSPVQVERMKRQSLSIYEERFNPRVMARRYEQIVERYVETAAPVEARASA